LNIKLKEKFPQKMLHQEGNKRLGEMSHGRKEERGRKMRRSIGTTEMD
jgi:hypothetical protein